MSYEFWELHGFALGFRRILRGKALSCRFPGQKWLPDMDLNHDKQIQSLLCYRYTIGQMETENLRNLNAESSLASS